MADSVVPLEVEELEVEFGRLGLSPLWTQLGSLMPAAPRPGCKPYLWQWAKVRPLAIRAAELISVGRGGERRALALANPALAGRPFATPTLWAAIQCLGPHEYAPAHRHSQSAFRFVLEGSGVWTVVDGEPISMNRGDLLLTPAWRWHEHHNVAATPMLWLDGLDIPLVGLLDAEFFELGSDTLSNATTPPRSTSERLWGQAGLLPIGMEVEHRRPLSAYRWDAIDAAIQAQLELEDKGLVRLRDPGHAAVRIVDPGTGSDPLPTMRLEVHRIHPGGQVASGRVIGSSIHTVLNGEGTFDVDGHIFDCTAGDIVAVPSWSEFRIYSVQLMDVFSFSDAPVYESLGLRSSLPANRESR